MSIYGKGAKGKATKLHSKLVRSRGRCERCGESDYAKLECAHIISRTYSATRTDLDNAWALCHACHFRLSKWPREHSHFITETIGSEKYELLRAKAETVTKMNWEDEYARLKQIAKDLDISIA